MSRMIVDDHVSPGEGALDVADDRADMADHVAGPTVHRRGAGAHRGLGIDHGRPRLVLDADGLAGVGRSIGVGGQDGDDRLTHVAHLALREGPLRAGRVETHVGVRRLRARGRQRIRQLGEVFGEKHRHARKGPRWRRIDPDDPRVRVRRTNEREVAEGGRRDVVDEAPATGDQPLVFLASR